MTSCVDASWGRGNTEGMEPGTEAGKPGGRFWCRAGCPRPEEQKCSVQAREPTWNSGFPLLGGQERKTSNPKTASQSALGALTIGMSPHPQGGTSGAGQPVGVGRVGVGGRVPAQLAALHHEVGGAGLQDSCSKGGSGQIPRGLCCLCKIISVSLAPSLALANPNPSTDCQPARGNGAGRLLGDPRPWASVPSSGAAGRG